MHHLQFFDQTNDLFRLAFDFIEQTSQHLFLTGKAGTGKTTFLKQLRQKSKKNMVIGAPTGVAAINAGGVTLHSLFQLSLEPHIPNSRPKETFKFGKEKRTLLQQIDLLVIDEVSMLRADVLDAIDSVLRFIRRNKKPFGGVQMLYIGDMFQLPPVFKDDEWEILKNFYPSPFFFHAKAIEQAMPLYLELKKVYRQQNQSFVDILNRVRNNILSPSDIALLNERYKPHFEPPPQERYITLTTHNFQSDQINKQKLDTLPGKPVVFSGETTGDFPDYALPTDMYLCLKKGAQVMFIKNDSSNPSRYFNGKIAKISRIEKDEIYVFPEDSDQEIKVEKEDWNNVRYTLNQETGHIEEENIGTFRQYPLRLAWAITIHKSQGLTFDKVMIDIERAFAAGQTYVALSRCTSLEGITLQSPLRTNCIQTNHYALNLEKQEKPVEELNQLLKKAKQKFWDEQLLQAFDWNPLLRLLYDYKKFTQDKLSDELQSAHDLSMELYLTAKEQQKIAERFQNQLETLLAQWKITHDLEPLKIRCCKAVSYFYDEIRLQIILPLQIHKSEFTQQKKAKAYWRFLNELETNIILFVNRLSKLYYNNILLTESITLVPIKQQGLFSEEKKEKSTKNRKKQASTLKKTEKNHAIKPVLADKIASKTISLELFKKEKSIAEIATERNLAVSTIESHLLPFIVTGELSVNRFLSEEKLNAILPLLQKNEIGTLGPIKEQLDASFSYSDIRAAINHLKWLENREKKG